LWGRDGKRYGLPKDWDTVAVIYNADALKAAGVTVEEVNAATWNAQDGGTFGQILAKLTLDANGKNGLDPAFDKANVAQYGFATGGMGGAYGQTEWSMFAASNGFKFNNGVWGNEYYYDDPKLAETMQWLANLWLVQGYAPPLADQTSLGRTSLFQSKGGVGHRRLVDDRHLPRQRIPRRLRPFARRPQWPQEHVQRLGGLDLRRHQAR
jgi:multiple sugar transport system substrate-binding protein